MVMAEALTKEELLTKLTGLEDYGFTGEGIEYGSLLITYWTQDEAPIYFVYGEDDESEDGIFQSGSPEAVAEFVFKYNQ